MRTDRPPFSFRDIPASCFPFVVEYIRVDNDEVVLRQEVDGPGVLQVPALGREPMKVRVSYADGTVVEHAT